MDSKEKRPGAGAQMVDISRATLRKLTEVQREGILAYMDLSIGYLRDLGEVEDFAGWVDIQRAFNQALWDHLRDNLRAGSDVLQAAVDDTGDLLLDAFGSKPETRKSAATRTAKARKSASGARKSKAASGRKPPAETLPVH